MVDPTNSKGWTGDYPTKAHLPLASAEERAVHWRVIRIAAIFVAGAVVFGVLWQVLV